MLEVVDEYTDKLNQYQNQCKKLTKEFKNFTAYQSLKHLLESTAELLPLFREMVLPETDMRDRHWKELNEIAAEKFDWTGEFKMDHLIRGDFIKKSEDVEEIISSAKNQAKILDIITKVEN